MSERVLPLLAVGGSVALGVLVPILSVPGVAALFGLVGAATLVGVAKTLAARGLQRDGDDR